MGFHNERAAAGLGPSGLMSSQLHWVTSGHVLKGKQSIWNYKVITLRMLPENWQNWHNQGCHTYSNFFLSQNLLDNGKHELEKGTENLLVVIQFNTNVE